jgi:hypothetical protein
LQASSHQISPHGAFLLEENHREYWAIVQKESDYVPEKRSFPPNNPSSEKTIISNVNRVMLTNVDVDGNVIEKRGLGEKGRGKPLSGEALLKCPHCARVNKVVFVVTSYNQPTAIG